MVLVRKEAQGPMDLFDRFFGPMAGAVASTCHDVAGPSR